MADQIKTEKDASAEKAVSAANPALTKKRSGTDDDTLVPEEDVSEGEEGDIEANPGKEEATPENDPNMVDWNGPDDPENPMNWPDKDKWLNIITLSILTLVT